MSSADAMVITQGMAPRGLTLVEVLVALVLLAGVAGVALRTLAANSGLQEAANHRAEAVLLMQSVLDHPEGFTSGRTYNQRYLVEVNVTTDTQGRHGRLERVQARIVYDRDGRPTALTHELLRFAQ